MTLTSAIKARRSIRSYQNKKVSRGLIKELLELANLAPTACGLENRRFIVIDNPQIKKQLYLAACKQEHILEAAVVVVMATNTQRFFPKKELKKTITEKWEMALPKKFDLNYRLWKQLYPLQDADTAAATLLLAATDKGLATCWVGAFDFPGVEKILKIPKNWKVTALITLGYQKNPPYPQKRNKIEKLVHWNKW